MSQLKIIAAKKVLVEEFRQVLSQLNDSQRPKLKGWKLVIDTRPKSRLGQCRYRVQEIGISSWLLELNEPNHAEIVDTLRHEVAHVLAGPGKGHGAVWRRYATAVGAKPLACCNAEQCGLVTPRSKSKITGTCGSCGKKFRRLRRPRRLMCCGGCQKKFRVLGYPIDEVNSKSRISWFGG